MEIISQVLIRLIAVAHLYTLWIEMFAWETRGRVVFNGILPPDVFKTTKAIAANLGLYNGFLAAGLVWTFYISDAAWKENISLFFLSCIAVAGVYGALTGPRIIFFFQALPALLALLVLVFT